MCGGQRNLSPRFKHKSSQRATHSGAEPGYLRPTRSPSGTSYMGSDHRTVWKCLSLGRVWENASRTPNFFYLVKENSQHALIKQTTEFFSGSKLLLAACFFARALLSGTLGGGKISWPGSRVEMTSEWSNARPKTLQSWSCSLVLICCVSPKLHQMRKKTRRNESVNHSCALPFLWFVFFFLQGFA